MIRTTFYFIMQSIVPKVGSWSGRLGRFDDNVSYSANALLFLQIYVIILMILRDWDDKSVDL